jgi:vacuolar iron transporter family protein
MRESLMTGISFGLTSGIITTLGLMVGLNSGTHSKSVVIGGILTIAIADAFSDALGIHMSEESSVTGSKSIWESTISTFLSKLIFALTFVVPVLLLPLEKAILASVVWGLLALATLSHIVAKRENENPVKVIGEHLFIAMIVILLTNSVGGWISAAFA